MQPARGPAPPINRLPANLNVPGVPPNNASKLPSQTYVQSYSNMGPGQSTQYISAGSAVNRNINRQQIISQPIQRPISNPLITIDMPPQQVITQQQTLHAPSAPKPQTKSRVEYIPYQKKVVDYETRQVVNTMWVPVQRKCLNYYAIEHITEYLPRQVDDVRYETVPQQYVQYRLQYVPVEKEIVHLPGDAINGPPGYVNPNAFAYGNAQGYIPGVTQAYPQGFAQTTNVISGSAGFRPGIGAVNPTSIPGFTQLQGRGPVPKSNFVTSDGYVPSYLYSNPVINESLFTPQNITNLGQPVSNRLSSSNVGNVGNFGNAGNVGNAVNNDVRRQSYIKQSSFREEKRDSYGGFQSNPYEKKQSFGSQRNSKYDLLGY